MKIVHLNTFDNGGGAAIAARRLHRAMLLAGIESKLIVQNQSIFDDPSVNRVSRLDDKIISLVRREFASRLVPEYDRSLGLYSYGGVGTALHRIDEVKDADIIYIHWINHGMMSLSGIKQILSIGKPVYWVMHDMWPITGGCHYSFDCLGYTTDCIGCKFFEQNKHRIAARQLKDKKSKLGPYKNLVYVAPSKWLAKCARSSTVAEYKDVLHIPNPIDLEIFKPLDRKFARSVFNLPLDKKIILFGADAATTNPYKGWRYLLESLSLLDLSDKKLIIFGASHGTDIDTLKNADFTFVGKLVDEQLLSILYNCADVFVTPSIADNFPNTIVESIACGTPVVGFDVGGIPDLVNSTTGYLAKYRNSADLKTGIATCLAQGQSEYSRRGCAESIAGLSFSSVVEQHRRAWSKITLKTPESGLTGTLDN